MVFEALKFMVLGMGIVFLFLILMIVLLTLQAKIIKTFFKEEEHTNTKLSPKMLPNDKKTIAIISSAINQHMKNKG
jgi:oxaloacetate decarboxylase gamma subunit